MAAHASAKPLAKPLTIVVVSPQGPAVAVLNCSSGLYCLRSAAAPTHAPGFVLRPGSRKGVPVESHRDTVVPDGKLTHPCSRWTSSLERLHDERMLGKT